MAGASDYLENKLLDAIFGNGFTKPATVYIAAFTVMPTDAGGGTEPSGNNYSRVTVTNNATNFPDAASGVKANGTLIQFPTASGSWGTIVGWGIYDASSGGNLLFYAPLDANEAIGSSQILELAIGKLKITMSDSSSHGASDYAKNKMLDAILGVGFTKPATVYLALFTATPNAAGGGTEVPSSNNYARASKTNNTTNFANASGGAKSNTTAVTFNTSSGSWGTITSWAWMDALTGGNMLWFGQLSPSVAVGGSATPSFAAAAIALGVD